MAAKESPVQPGFRRRIPLELTASELSLLEKAETQFGTKRATLVAGLEALARLEAIEGELAKATKACEVAAARSAELETRAERAEESLAKTREQAGRARSSTSVAGRKAEDARLRAAAEAEQLAQSLAAERELVARLENELEDLEAEQLDALFCWRCGKWAYSDEWAEHEDSEATLVYHRSCGFHKTRGLTGNAGSVLGFRERR